MRSFEPNKTVTKSKRSTDQALTYFLLHVQIMVLNIWYEYSLCRTLVSHFQRVMLFCWYFRVQYEVLNITNYELFREPLIYYSSNIS